MTKKMTSKYIAIALLLISCNCAQSGINTTQLSTNGNGFVQEAVRIIPYQGQATYKVSNNDTFTISLLYYQGNYYGRSIVSVLDGSNLSVRTSAGHYLFFELPPCFIVDISKSQGSFAEVSAVPEPTALALTAIGLTVLRRVTH